MRRCSVRVCHLGEKRINDVSPFLFPFFVTLLFCARFLFCFAFFDVALFDVAFFDVAFFDDAFFDVAFFLCKSW